MAPQIDLSSLRPSNLFKKDVSTHVHEIKIDEGSSSGSLPRITGKEHGFGMNAAIKTFYEGRNSNRSENGTNYDWVETPPRQLSSSKARKFDGVALKLYKIKDHDQPTLLGRTPLKIHMIDVQSPHLIVALKDIVAKEGMYLEVHEIARFEAPFRPLYFSYEAIRAKYRKAGAAGEEVLAAHLRLLLSVMSELFDGFQMSLKHLHDSKLISYKLAWTYFPKNTVVYSTCDGTERLIRTTDTAYVDGKEPGLIICGEHFAFDGDAFRWQPLTVKIARFIGNQPIDDMSVYPFSFHKDQEGVKERLTERGHKVLEYQDVTMRDCEGMATVETAEGEGKILLTGRVLVDFYGYHKYHKGLERSEVRDEKAEKERKKREMEMDALRFECKVDHLPPELPNSGPPIKSGQSPRQKKADVYVKRLTEEEQKTNREQVLKKPADLPFLSPNLCGYSLKHKMWLQFHVGDLKPCEWNDEAYGHLVYPEEQKDLVLSFVANHKAAPPKKGDASDDVILGKGRGLVILLSGPPGTGKTLTAEATADATRRPLYALHAEDLGTNAAALGASLKRAFNMAADWNAVVLLDEADVFMAMRHPSDVHRNELVSIFLRELEYFSGTIFLTTNLLQNIDPAFRSRVDIHLLFNPLSASSRELLWRKFLKRLPAAKTNVNTSEGDEASESDDSRTITAGSEVNPGRTVAPLSDASYRQLARWDLNGREIKNAVKTVRTWCECKRNTIDLGRLEAGINVTAPRAVKLADGEASRQGREWANHVGTVGGGWGDDRANSDSTNLYM